MFWKRITKGRRHQTLEDVLVEDPVDIRLKQSLLILACERFVKLTVRKQISGLKEEFESLKRYVPPDPSAVAFMRNKAKNRYADIPCYDKTRVTLKTHAAKEAYIHANYVNSSLCLLPNKYICTQGPMENTILDFWRMIIQEKVRHIVMLCQPIEAGKSKCAVYYPVNKGETRKFGDITVTVIGDKQVENRKHFRILEMTVSSPACPEFKIQHYRCIDWPDFGVPTSALGILRILHEIRSHRTPVVAHCSAGVGRTGTLIAIEVGIRCIVERKDFQVLDIAKELRAQRANSIQTEGQYLFIYRVLMEYVKSRKKMPEIDQFTTQYTEYLAQQNRQRSPLVFTPTLSPAMKKSYTPNNHDSPPPMVPQRSMNPLQFQK